MKKIVIYYSMLGNTEYVANHISKRLNCDVLRIRPKKEYPAKGFRKFYHAGKSSVMEECPELEDYSFDSKKYDLIIFGTPVWASNYVPPLRTFINENKKELTNKKFAVFTCFSGGGADKAIYKLKKTLEIDNFEQELILINPKVKETEENINNIDDFCSHLEKGD